MADKKKANNGIKSSRRSKIILGSFITVFILIILGFFIFVTGALQKFVTGIKITQTSAEGNVTTLENISVAEANYHYYQVLNTFYGYGMIQGEEQLEEVMDESTGKTWYQFLMDQAANEIMNSVIVNRKAEEAGYLQYSGAARYADLNIESMRRMASMYGYPTAEQYLQAMYGRGMSTRVFRNCIMREALTNEYEAYVRQFVFTASEEEIQAAYDADPLVYERVDFNYYYFPGTADEEGNYDLAEANAKADAVVAASTDSESFKNAVIAQLDAEDPSLDSFSDDYDPTFAEGYSNANTDMMAEGFSDFLFGEDTELGSCTTIEDASGVYVVMLADRYVNEDPAVTYRTLTMYNPALDLDEPTDEDLINGQNEMTNRANELAASATDSMSFVALVKENSEVPSEIISGGYIDGIDASQFEYSETNPISQQQIDLGTWLFDESRVAGDTLVQVSEDGSGVTIYYFENSVPMWMYTARNQLVTAMVNGWSADITNEGVSYAIAYDLMRTLSK